MPRLTLTTHSSPWPWYEYFCNAQLQNNSGIQAFENLDIQLYRQGLFNELRYFHRTDSGSARRAVGGEVAFYLPFKPSSVLLKSRHKLREQPRRRPGAG